MSSFWSLPYDSRFAAYAAIEAAGCRTYNSGGGCQLSVAVARGRFGEVTHALEQLGLRQVDLYRFPLGTDRPPEEFQHGGNWLVACFLPAGGSDD